MSLRWLPYLLPDILRSAGPDSVKGSRFSLRDMGFIFRGCAAMFFRKNRLRRTQKRRKTVLVRRRSGRTAPANAPLVLLCGQSGRLMSAVRRFCRGISCGRRFLPGGVFWRSHRIPFAKAGICVKASCPDQRQRRPQRLYIPRGGIFPCTPIVDPKKRFVKRKHEIHTKKAGKRSRRGRRREKQEKNGRKTGGSGRFPRKKRSRRKRKSHGGNAV